MNSILTNIGAVNIYYNKKLLPIRKRTKKVSYIYK